MKTTIITLICTFSCLVQAAEILPNLRQINENIYRSGRPTEKGLTELQAAGGIRTIINLDDSSSQDKKEAAWAKKLGINYRPFPTSSFNRPKDEAINAVLTIMNDPSQYPILVHCKHGEDRTGMVAGLYRVFTDKWEPEAAYEEMLDLGFHPLLFNLDKYFKDRTGYQNLWNFPDFSYLPNKKSPLPTKKAKAALERSRLIF